MHYLEICIEGYDILKLEKIKQAHTEFIDIANLWTEISNLFLQVSKTKDRKYIEQASDILKQLSTKEKNAIQNLAEI